MTKDEALRLALEALSPDPYRSEWAVEEDKCKAITAIKAALEAKDEPVAWRFKTGTFWNREVHWRYVLSLEGTEGLKGLEPLYTTPPQRTWVGLTIDEREQIQQECFGKVPHHVAFAHAIEAKLKEKNT